MENNVISLKMINDVLALYECQQKPIIIKDKLTLQKEKVKNINQNRQKMYETRLKEYNTRINKIQKQNDIAKIKRAEANHEKELRIKDRLSTIKTNRYLKQVHLKKSIKDKEIRSQKALVERRNLKPCKKQDLKGVRGDSKSRSKALDDSENWFSEPEEEFNDEPLKGANEERICADLDQSKLEAFSFQECNLQMHLERISKLKKPCENYAGSNFFEKTAPIWDSLTQCINRKSFTLGDIAKDSEDMIPEEYRKLTMNKQSSVKQIQNSWLSESLKLDLDYEISDTDVLKAIAKAKRLAGESAAATAIIHLVKNILDESRIIQYVCTGVSRRTVFEHMKRRMSYRMLERSQYMINRLRNTMDSIPKRLLASVDGERLVEPIIFAFIKDTSPDGKSADLLDPVAAYANRVRAAMKELLKTDRDAKNECYKLPGKNYVEKHVDKHVGRIMMVVSKRIASVLANNSLTPVRDPPSSQLPSKKFHILARKMTKIVFGMDYCPDEQIYTMNVIMTKIVGQIAQRCPRVMYKKKRK